MLFIKYRLTVKYRYIYAKNIDNYDKQRIFLNSKYMYLFTIFNYLKFFIRGMGKKDCFIENESNDIFQ